jgi:hypothetical protein
MKHIRNTLRSDFSLVILSDSRESRFLAKYGRFLGHFHGGNQMTAWARSREGIDSGDLGLDHGDLVLDHGDLVLDHGDLVLDHGDLVLDHGDLVLDHGDLVLDHGDLCLVSCGTNKIENSRNRAVRAITMDKGGLSVRFHHNYHLIPKGKNPPGHVRAVHVVDADIIPTFICEI